PDASTDAEIEEAFREARQRDFDALATDARRLGQLARRRPSGRVSRQLTQGVRRLRERFEQKAAIDFVGAPGREDVASLLLELDELTGRRRSMETRRTTAANVADFRNRVWVTRPRPGVDRMSSAWLIRRFIDANARFVFGAPRSPAASAVPFDTFEAEF